MATTLAGSRLLPEALSRLTQSDGSYRVLDLGPGSHHTTRFFSDVAACENRMRHVRLYFCDCLELFTRLNKTSAPDQPEDQPEEQPTYLQRVAAWREQLGLAGDETLDLVLFWDYLHYFDKDTLDALSSALQPHIQRHTRGYGFGNLRPGQKLPCRQYGVHALDSISCADLPEESLPYGHSQKFLSEHFSCMRIARSTLLQEGHLELLFEN